MAGEDARKRFFDEIVAANWHRIQGDVELTFTFKVDGDTLTGGVESPMNQFPISNGKISGDEFSFDVDTGTDNVSHQCRISGDTIHMKSQGPWGEMEMVLKRVAESN